MYGIWMRIIIDNDDDIDDNDNIDGNDDIDDDDSIIVIMDDYIYDDDH